MEDRKPAYYLRLRDPVGRRGGGGNLDIYSEARSATVNRSVIEDRLHSGEAHAWAHDRELVYWSD